MTEGWAELAEAISAIRAGIEKAVIDGASSGVRFEVGPVELELAATVHKAAGGEVKVSLLPWSASAKGDTSVNHTQRIKLTLQPMDPESVKEASPDGKPRKLLIADEADGRPR